ncbi:MAG: type II toxin-antitoxin system VapC family toxin [Nitrososphaerales archaeon]
MRVIDSSSLVKFFSREEGWNRVEEVMLEGVVSLGLSLKEVINALWKKVLNEEMKTQDAEEILKDLTKQEVIKILNQNDYMLGAFKIAVENKITIYDALFIELAKSTNNELVTSDSKQAEIARKEGVKIIL